MEEPKTVSVEMMAAMNAAQVGVANLMWMTKIARAMTQDEVVFESPDEMVMFRDQITLVLASVVMRDTALMVSTLCDMGMPDLAALVRDSPLLQGNGGSVAETVRQAIAEGENLNPDILAFFDDFPDA